MRTSENRKSGIVVCALFVFSAFIIGSFPSSAKADSVVVIFDAGTTKRNHSFMG